MIRAALVAGLSAGISVGLVLWTTEGMPLWALLVAAVLGAVPAHAFVIMQESVFEDLLKAFLFLALATALVLQGMPAWLYIPLAVGPVMGLLGVDRSPRDPESA